MSGALVARSRQLRYMFDRKTCLSLDELLCLGPCWSLNKTILFLRSISVAQRRRCVKTVEFHLFTTVLSRSVATGWTRPPAST